MAAGKIAWAFHRRISKDCCNVQINLCHFQREKSSLVIPTMVFDSPTGISNCTLNSLSNIISMKGEVKH